MSRPFFGGNRGRKTHSLDGSVPGVEYNRRRGGYSRMPFDRQVSIDSPQPVQEYNPDPGNPEFRESHYEAYEAEMRQQQTPAFRMPLPETPAVDPPPHCNNCLITEELFTQALDETMHQPDAPEPGPANLEVRATRIMNNSESLDGLVAGQSSPPDPCQEIADAMNEQTQEMAPPPPPPPEPDPEPDPWDQVFRPYPMPGPMEPGPMM